ncbi:MAG: hypothetical protein DRJ18_00235 [Candidatus Methanomethylicota archaeon]|nr:MAG: hypothetical protein DRJ18_00235 [Candidatus Verstraetearchaeota archaeon]
MCRVKAKVKGKPVILQTMGYRGKSEAKTPLADLRQARTMVVPKSEARKIGLKVGSTVTVKIGKAKIPAEVKRWSYGSRLLVPKEEYPFKRLSTKTLSKYLIP